MTQTERRRFLLSSLLAEAPEYRQLAVPDDAAGQKQLLRALLNVRPPRDASPEFLQVQDEYLRAELAQKGVTVLESLTPAARCGEAALYLWQGDITTLQCDAIVNAANCSLLGGGGVDGAIHMAAGTGLLNECRGLNGCKTGEAKITRGYRLPARHVIHTPGPRWRDGQHGEPELLANCYRNSLRLASENDCHTVDFPSISTGIYHFPLDQAAQIAVREITRYLADHPEMTRVRMVCFDSRTRAAYEAALAAQECAG